jgi:hypothetical protein
MERLHVRTLDGLNLREALELLRRQVLEEAGQAAAGPSSAPASVAHPAAHTTSARPPAVPVAPPAPEPGVGGGGFFDEEEDFDVTFSLSEETGDLISDEEDADEVEDDAFGRAAERGPALDDVPDFAAPASGRSGSAAMSTQRAPATESPSASPEPASRARAQALIEQWRATLPGGVALPQQLTAYTNLIVGQLDAARARALVQGLWRTPAEQLGTDQLQALIRWAKEDAFDEEVRAVLAALAAERTAGANSAARGARGARASGAAARPGAAEGTR